MPTYVYRCPACGLTKELIQKISERVNPTCDSGTCPSDTQMTRLITATSFILKGGGWAKDGYK